MKTETPSNRVQVQIGPGFMGSLFITFLVLKLTSVIDWSWWWITAPLWGPVALLLICISGVLVLGVGANIIDGMINGRRK